MSEIQDTRDMLTEYGIEFPTTASFGQLKALLDREVRSRIGANAETDGNEMSSAGATSSSNKPDDKEAGTAVDDDDDQVLAALTKKIKILQLRKQIKELENEVQPDCVPHPHSPARRSSENGSHFDQPYRVSLSDMQHSVPEFSGDDRRSFVDS